jgi:hypothetical protein
MHSCSSYLSFLCECGCNYGCTLPNIANFSSTWSEFSVCKTVVSYWFIVSCCVWMDEPSVTLNQ